MMTFAYPARIAVALASIAAMLSLGGCAFTNTTAASKEGPTPATQHQVTGLVHGGQQPVTGALLQLYAVGNRGLKSASTPLISATVRTDSGGGFNITGLWNCNDTATYGSDPLLYLVATGGNPGISGSATNPALALMVALGRCSALTPQTFLSVNEVTTVATVYALAPFMADITHVGTSAAAPKGLRSAFDTVSTLVNAATGLSPGPAALAGETVPVSEIDSLADSLATCVNSDGTSLCDSLFAATTAPGGNAPTNTIEATLALAKSPERNAAAFYNLASAAAPFQPQLSRAPSDWTMMLRFTGSGLSGPAGIALDGSGNAWVANGSGSGVTGLSNQGAPLTGANGYGGDGGIPTIYGAQGVAVDHAGNVWVADTLLSSVVKLSVSGGIVQSSASFTNGVDGPIGLVVDKDNNVWVANFNGGSVTELSNTGSVMGSGPLTASGTLASPSGIATDSRGDIWVTDNGNSIVAKFDSSQALLSGTGFSDGSILAPQGIAIDSMGRAWVADNGIAAASLFASDGSSVATSPISGGGLSLPDAVALDGADVAWLANGTSSGSLTRLVSSSTTTATKLGALSAPGAVAIDAGGNVWTANSGDDSVSKFVGLAVPVITP